MPILIFVFGLFFYIYCEISLLVSVGSSIGVFPLILVMIAISAIGLWLLKLRGVMTVLQIRQQLAQGQLPTQAVISSVFFAIAGVLFLIPGFLSDILALLLLLPFTRSLIQGIAVKAFASKVKFQTFSEHRPDRSNTTFEAEFERKQDEDKWLK
ncbi:FxsA family protein [Muribacter muris]|uniref:FxsA family protein n=1 Tax=Muribacter muris TaxID=67855 RepID=A0A4Y9JV61_9PAST|nr:FxsA family protein [Muribacter muris]MBF0785567.1 FxsA family protein [Muribacter muris]MBF0827118.1 FxsA family protein [Muribacter muris]TFV09182.1 FxsA family protein [Muribacter muris]